MSRLRKSWKLNWSCRSNKVSLEKQSTMILLLCVRVSRTFSTSYELTMILLKGRSFPFDVVSVDSMRFLPFSLSCLLNLSAIGFKPSLIGLYSLYMSLRDSKLFYWNSVMIPPYSLSSNCYWCLTRISSRNTASNLVSKFGQHKHLSSLFFSFCSSKSAYYR